MTAIPESTPFTPEEQKTIDAVREIVYANYQPEPGQTLGEVLAANDVHGETIVSLMEAAFEAGVNSK